MGQCCSTLLLLTITTVFVQMTQLVLDCLLEEWTCKNQFILDIKKTLLALSPFLLHTLSKYRIHRFDWLSGITWDNLQWMQLVCEFPGRLNQCCIVWRSCAGDDRKHCQNLAILNDLSVIGPDCGWPISDPCARGREKLCLLILN